MPYQLPPPCYPNKFAPPTNLLPNPFLWCQPWSTLVEGGMERYRSPGKLTLELVLANQNKLLCLWTMQLTKWAGKVPYLLLLKCSMPELIFLIKASSLSLSTAGPFLVQQKLAHNF